MACRHLGRRCLGFFAQQLLAANQKSHGDALPSLVCDGIEFSTFIKHQNDVVM